MIVDKVTDLIGNTPMLRVPVPGRETRLLLKMEKMNPGGSTKDRMAHSMVLAAIKAGRLAPGGVVVESSSGNTGIGLAIAAVEFGLRFIAVVDHHAAPDKIAVMRALGAEIRFVEGNYREDEVAVVERQRMAARIAAEIPGAVFMNQSDNTANAGGYSAFVREAIAQAEGRIDAYVGCVGTGGSMTGIGHGLKAHDAETVIVAVEPDGSIVFGGPGHPITSRAPARRRATPSASCSITAASTSACGSPIPKPSRPRAISPAAPVFSSAAPPAAPCTRRSNSSPRGASPATS